MEVIIACLITIYGVVCDTPPPLLAEPIAYVCDQTGCYDRGIVGGPGRYVYPGYQGDRNYYGDHPYTDRGYDYGPNVSVSPWGVERRQDRRQYRRYERRDY